MESLFPYLIWGGLFFLMMRFGCGSHMFGHRHGDQNHSGHETHGGGHAHGCCGPAPDGTPKANQERHAQPPASAGHRDPVCGKTVTADAAKTSFHAGTVHYFCSRDCREIFEAAPEAYLSEDGASAYRSSVPLIPNRSPEKPHIDRSITR